ncbi:polyprenyl synthetase family protein [Corallococcus terminator]
MRFAPPTDWPGPGPIDLELHDRPHASSGLEWWYVNAHFAVEDGRPFSVFAAFFRHPWSQRGKPKTWAHSVVWGLTDVVGRRYHATSLLDPRTPELVLRWLDSHPESREGIARRALREILRRGHVPLPDQLASHSAHASEDRLELELEGNRLRRGQGGRYEVVLVDRTRDVQVQLHFQPEKPPIRHADDGVVHGHEGEEMFYYFIPRCRVEGTLHVEGRAWKTRKGTGWYDHEFGAAGRSEEDGARGSSLSAWSWLSGQLDNGVDLSGFTMFGQAPPHRPLGQRLLRIDPRGGRRETLDFQLQPTAHWTSLGTFSEHPVSWALDAPDFALHLHIEAELPGQEVITLLSLPSFWEGRVRLSGTMEGQPVQGLGFVERSRFDRFDAMDAFFASVGRETRRQVDLMLPRRLDTARAEKLIASRERRELLEDVDVSRYERAVVAPIRDMIDRGGKAWRSYALVAAVELLGGDAERYREQLAYPEVLQAGSLIIDDVEDDSERRRGGPACHTVYGRSLAINAGSLCMFLIEDIASRPWLTGEQSARIFQLYFEALRAAHAGQALDIQGLDDLLPEAVERGDGSQLERELLAVARMKTAAPPAALARIAGVYSNAPEDRVHALATLYESYGVSFQIIDDVLDLRGFEDETKHRGEDVTSGKVTLPIAKALSRLEIDDRRWLQQTLAARSSDPGTLASLTRKLEACGALSACVQQARERVEAAWTVLDALFPDSFTKLHLRAFGWYVLERQR